MRTAIVQILDEDLLRRWVPHHQVDETGKIMSVFFRGEDKSADLVKLRPDRAETLADSPSGAGLVEFTAGLARSEGLDPVHDPHPPEAPHNHAHVLCKGKLSSGRAQRMRDAVNYCVPCVKPPAP